LIVQNQILTEACSIPADAYHIYGVRKLPHETVNFANHRFTDGRVALLSFSVSDGKKI